MSPNRSTKRRLATGIATGAVLLATVGTASAAPCAPGTTAPVGTLGVEYLLDNSSSIWEGVLDTVPKTPPSDPTGLRGAAAKQGINQLANGDTVSVAKFSLAAKSIVAPTLLTADRASLIAKISPELAAADRGTDYDAAFTQAKLDIDNMCAAKKIVIFLSDGVPNSAGSDTGLHKLVGAPVYTVALGAAPGPRLQVIANETTGKFFQATTAAQIDDAFAQALNAAGVNSKDVAPGAAVDVPIAIPAGSPSLGVSTSWPSGAFTVSLISPAGTIDQQANAPVNSVVQITPTGASFQIPNPVAGAWTLRIVGGANPASVKVVTRIVVAPAVAPATPAPGTPTSPGSTTPGGGAVGKPDPLVAIKLTNLRGLKTTLTRGAANTISFTLSKAGPVKIAFVRAATKGGVKILKLQGKAGLNVVKLPAAFLPKTTVKGTFNVIVTPTGGKTAKLALKLKA